MTASRFHHLVPVNSTFAEDAALGNGSNDSVSSQANTSVTFIEEDDGTLLQNSQILFLSNLNLFSVNSYLKLNFEFDMENVAIGVNYRLPSSRIRDIVDAPPLSTLSFSPLRDKILFLKRRSLWSLVKLERPEEKLAGI